MLPVDPGSRLPDLADSNARSAAPWSCGGALTGRIESHRFRDWNLRRCGDDETHEVWARLHVDAVARAPHPDRRQRLGHRLARDLRTSGTGRTRASSCCNPTCCTASSPTGCGPPTIRGPSAGRRHRGVRGHRGHRGCGAFMAEHSWDAVSTGRDRFLEHLKAGLTRHPATAHPHRRVRGAPRRRSSVSRARADRWPVRLPLGGSPSGAVTTPRRRADRRPGLRGRWCRAAHRAPHDRRRRRRTARRAPRGDLKPGGALARTERRARSRPPDRSTTRRVGGRPPSSRSTRSRRNLALTSVRISSPRAKGTTRPSAGTLTTCASVERRRISIHSLSGS